MIIIKCYYYRIELNDYEEGDEKPFFNYPHLKREMALKAGIDNERPNYCSMCSKTFSTQSNLRRHINVSQIFYAGHPP